MEDCLFCKIIDKKIPADIVYEDDQVVAFKDINPAAPIHLLLVPRSHVPGTNDATEANQAELGHLFVAAAKIAKEQGFAAQGYRCIVNCNQDAGQVVFHLHMHLVAGRKMGWNPA